MSWRHVFDGNKGGAGSRIEQASSMAHSFGYKFMLFNDIIYFICVPPAVDDPVVEAFDTGPRVKDLF